MTDMTPTPTQHAYPWRTTIRTIVWYVLTVLAVIPAAAPILSETLGDVLPASWLAGYLTLAGITGAALVAVQRLVLLAPVAALLERVGLAPEPAARQAPARRA